MMLNLEAVSRVISHALRHEPGRYGLTLDPEGWVEIDDLLVGISRFRPALSGVTREVLAEIIATARKQRYEINGTKIRAFYGHSVAGHIERPATEPPPDLFHGTSPQAWEVIRREGLRPMDRQSVQLSTDRETAILVGRPKSPTPVILTVDARAANQAGVLFSLANKNIWLADFIEPRFIHTDD